MSDHLLDAKQAGELLNLPPTWLMAEARRDRVPHIRFGRYVRFDRAQLLAWADARHRGPVRRDLAHDWLTRQPEVGRNDGSADRPESAD